MKTLSKLAITAPAVVGAMALGLMAAAPAQAQSPYGDNRNESALLGAVLGAFLGQDDRAYAQSRGGDCDYFRDGRCYRNQGHWEREHGINSRDYNRGYGYDDRYERRRYVEGRTYQGRGYYRDGRFWRNHGDWRSSQNRRDRDYRYDRRW
jgi:hypothetical protein